MTEYVEHGAETAKSETYGEKIDRLTKAYYDGIDVTAEIKEVYEAAFSIWFYRSSFDVAEVGDGLVDIIRTLEMMLPDDQVPQGRIGFSGQ